MNALDTAAISEQFAPFQDMALRFIPYACGTEYDVAHDIEHLRRVWHMVQRIAAVEGGNLRILAAAAMLHDCVAVAKTSPDRHKASHFSALKARMLLERDEWPSDDIDAVCHAIEAHSFSANIEPKTLEARILMDADRLDGLGAIGIARCLMLSGTIGRGLYDPQDPFAERRPLDDVAWTLDHFPAKFLMVAEKIKTQTGREIAEQRHQTMLAFYNAVISEIPR